jgi:hypothetical protein
VEGSKAGHRAALMAWKRKYVQKKKSPWMSPVLEIFSPMSTDVGDVNFMPFHVRSEVGSWEDCCEERSSPNLADAKNAVVHVDHTTCLDCCDQLVNERRCPMVSSSGNITILLVSGIEGCRLSTPFSIRERTGSLGVSAQCRPFRWCTNFIARM